MKKLRLTAAALLIFSCFSHFGEAFVYEPAHAYGSMVFGMIYFILGILLFMRHPKAYISALIFTGIGLIAAIVLSLQGNLNFLMAIHIVINAFVIYVCVNYLRKKKK
jgi:energy-converting hydrogenase Eha subunit G